MAPASLPPLPAPAPARLPGAGLSAQRCELVVLEGEAAGATFPLLGSELRVGRAPENDVVLDHPSVSRAHLVVCREGERLLVQDLGSAQGTFLDGSRVREGLLRPGALLAVGQVRLRLRSQRVPVQVEPTPEERLLDLVGRSVPMRQVFALLRRVAPTDSAVVLVGETGAGKGAVARTLHRLSRRAGGPLVVFDCASARGTLVESELFGHERGAFIGALGQRLGCLERARGGTLLLDEVDGLPLALQPRLLRALEEGQLRRLGGATPVRFDVRLVVGTRRDLWEEAQAGRFCEELCCHLSTFTLCLPPLRERREDIPLLVDALGGEGLWARLPAPVREGLLGHTWPGNVRELHAALGRARRLEEPAGGLLGPEVAGAPETGRAEVLPVDYGGPFKACKETLVRAFEREYLRRLLTRSRGNIARAAREARLDRKYLYSLLHKYGLVAGDGR